MKTWIKAAASDYTITCCLIYLKSSYHYLVMQVLNCIHQVGTIKMIYMVLKLKSLCKLQDARYQSVDWKQKPLITPWHACTTLSYQFHVLNFLLLTSIHTYILKGVFAGIPLFVHSTTTTWWVVMTICVVSWMWTSSYILAFVYITHSMSSEFYVLFFSPVRLRQFVISLCIQMYLLILRNIWKMPKITK